LNKLGGAIVEAVLWIGNFWCFCV